METAAMLQVENEEGFQWNGEGGGGCQRHLAVTIESSWRVIGGS